MNPFKRTLGFIHSHPLAKRHLFLSYYKFLSWQISSLVNRELKKVPFIEGCNVWAKKGMNGITGNIYTGLHEFEDMAFLLHFLRKEDVFFDVGANVGSYSILASGVCNSKTIAFEPIQSTFQIIEKNIELNRLTNLLEAKNVGVGNQTSTVFFTSNQDTTNHILTKDEIEDNSIEVELVKLDTFYPETKPALLKIDVEGFETEVLEGSTNVLNDSILKAIIIELNGSGNKYGFNEEEIHKKLLALGFKPYKYYPFSRELTELETHGQNNNTLYLRDLTFVNKRLKTASSFRIFGENI